MEGWYLQSAMSDSERKLRKTFVKVTSLHQQNWNDRNAEAAGFNTLGSHQKLIHSFGGKTLKDRKHNKHRHIRKDNAAKRDIKETGLENTRWVYRFQHTGLIVFCEHTNEHCGSVKSGIWRGGGERAYSLNERQLFSSQK